MVDQSESAWIKIPYPPGRELRFKINAPLCHLVIAPGLGGPWATGTYHDPHVVMPLNVSQSGSQAEITAVGAFAYRTPPAYLPQLKLSFGRTRPFALSIVTGGLSDPHSDDLNFGGLPLTGLEIQYGAGEQNVHQTGEACLDFSTPNPQVMKRLKILADSTHVRVENLAHANALQVRLAGEASHYRLEFGTALPRGMQRSMLLHIGPSVARVELSLPAAAAVKVVSDRPPHTAPGNEFTSLKRAYWNTPALENPEPLLTVNSGASAALYINTF